MDASREPPALAPLSRCRFTVAGLAEALASAGAGTELLVDFEFVTKEDCLWAKKGWAVARDQVALRSPAVALPAAQAAADVAFAEDDRTVSVSFAKTKAAFCRKSGTLCELVLDGKTVLKDPAPDVVTGPRFTIERAFVDNDSWMRMGGHWRFKAEDSFYYRGLSQLRYHVRPFVREVAEDIPGRCIKCYEMRLFETARRAKEEGLDAFTSSLFISPYQKHETK